MKKKILWINSVIIVLMLLLVFGLSVVVTGNNNQERAKQEVKRLTAIYVDCYATGGALDGAEDVRVTVISSTGQVLSDSDSEDVSTLDNHLARPEISSALQGKPTVDTRKSRTTGREMMYYAQKVDVADGYVFVRVAIPVESINAFLIKSVPLTVAIIFFALMIEFLVSIALNSWALRPLSAVKRGLQSLNDGTFVRMVPAEGDGDLDEMLRSINELGDKLHALLKTGVKEQNKLNFILDHITNGVVAFDGKGDILLANARAMDIFEVTKDVVGQGYRSLTDDGVILERIGGCVAGGEDGVFETEKEGRYFLVTLKRTTDDMLILVVADVTDRKKNEKTRSEFFANASHELKTPLTSLRGFTELALMKEEDGEIKGYLTQMERDVRRMLALIDDMLKLSNLEHTKADEVTSVDMRSVAQEVLQDLDPAILEKQLEVDLMGTGTVLARRDDIYALEKNLIENAVRYTEKKGRIKITLEEGAGVKFTVKDNGIGIASKHHSRIFERFYRVEKSRSRQSGGTGLGLSIVKHVAERYGATITLKSKEGVGTTISVSFCG